MAWTRLLATFEARVRSSIRLSVFLQRENYWQRNPAIITSRPAGYRQSYFRTDEFPHYDLQPFDQKRIDQFIQNWYDNRFQDPEESNDGNAL
jgi:predicted NACHT family NTPase